MMQNNTHFGAYLYSADSEHRTLHQSFVTMSRVTFFLFNVPTLEPALATANTGKTLESFGKMKMNGLGR